MNVYVYLITDGQHTKIGISTDPQSRLKEIQTGNPKSLQLQKIYACHDDVSASWVEKLIHKRYESDRLSGEWFSTPSSVIIRDIAWALDIATGIAATQIQNPPKPQRRPKRNTYTRVNNASQKVKEYLDANPQDRSLTVRELEKLIGVGKSTISRVINDE